MHQPSTSRAHGAERAAQTPHRNTTDTHPFPGRDLWPETPVLLNYLVNLQLAPLSFRDKAITAQSIPFIQVGICSPAALLWSRESLGLATSINTPPNQLKASLPFQYSQLEEIRITIVSACLSFYLPVYLYIYPTIYLPIDLSIHPSTLPSTLPSAYLSINPSIHASPHLFFIHPSISLSIRNETEKEREGFFSPWKNRSFK